MIILIDNWKRQKFDYDSHINIQNKIIVYFLLLTDMRQKRFQTIILITFYSAADDIFYNNVSNRFLPLYIIFEVLGLWCTLKHFETTNFATNLNITKISMLYWEGEKPCRAVSVRWHINYLRFDVKFVP